MGFKDKERQKEYVRNYMKRKRENERNTSIEVSVVLQPVVQQAESIFAPIVQDVPAPTGDLKDQIIANLLQQVETLKAENLMLRNGYGINMATPMASQQQTFQTVTVSRTKPKSLEVYASEKFADALNCKYVLTQLPANVSEEDCCLCFKADADIDDVVIAIIKRALPMESRPLIRSKSDYAIKNDDTWAIVEAEEFNETIKIMAVTVQHHLRKMFMKIRKECKIDGDKYWYKGVSFIDDKVYCKFNNFEYNDAIRKKISAAFKVDIM